MVSLERQEPDYFETPAPGWRHGCRFSHGRLTSWLDECGWEVVDQMQNELPGNRLRRDRGSSYFICRRSAHASNSSGTGQG